MLKSTYKPAPLPPGWTEHKAPTGHTYYYNAETKESTYRRPAVPAPQPAPAPAPATYYPNLSDPHIANAYLAQFSQQTRPPPRGGRGGFDGRPRPQPTDRPRRKEPIPGCEPWVLVYTKYSRRFVYNPAKNASYWRLPEKLMAGILELDKARIRDKATAGGGEAKAASEAADGASKEVGGASKEAGGASKEADEAGKEALVDEFGDSSEYEEVEVTDDEGDNNDNDDEQAGHEAPHGEHPSKRQRTDGAADGGPQAQDGPVEFTEADIAAQLQLMGDVYGLEPGDYDDGNMDDWPEGVEGVDFSQEDAKCLFKDLLNDFNIKPYSPWDKLMEEGRIIDDARYTALGTTRLRKACWDEWSRDKIAELKAQRARQHKTDPRVAYMALLQDKATPKLYWPEFKRKYKKEEAMKDLQLSDKEREKAYREHISRLKLPPTRLKADLTALLRAQPSHVLHKQSLPGGLPTPVLADLRYISLPAAVRDPLVEAYVQSLPPPAPDADAAADEAGAKEREARARRERALRERDRLVEEQKRRRERDVAASKARLREGERELDMAMRLGKRGLQSQLLARDGTEGGQGGLA